MEEVGRPSRWEGSRPVGAWASGDDGLFALSSQLEAGPGAFGLASSSSSVGRAAAAAAAAAAPPVVHTSGRAATRIVGSCME